MRQVVLILFLFTPTIVLYGEDSGVLPTPQDFQRTHGAISLSGEITVDYLLPDAPSEKLEIAVGLIDEALRDAEVEITPHRYGLLEQQSGGDLKVLLASYADWTRPGDSDRREVLSFSDRELLSSPSATGQEYVLWVDPANRSIYLIGSGGQGVLYAAVSLTQLIKGAAGEIQIEGCQIRDHPDFEYRLAADWLMNVEIDRWSYDWGDGIEAYSKRIKRKLDLCLRQKINMVLFHGYGWGTDLFPEFPALMQELNQYARQRGIHLVTGGYGASYGMSYQGGPLYEEAPYLGKLFLNRESYPEGKVYECMGFPRTRKGGMNPRTTGSCRANSDLNRLKAEELRNYVAKTEPGGLYIHFEDFGGFKGTQGSWLQRCDRCRARWPNDDLKAPDGGAGGLAHGYRELIEAVFSVKNPDTGYDASRDCIVVPISPVYITDSRSPADWENVVELWEETARLLPASRNIQIGFREIFPQQDTARRFVDDYNQAMERADRPFKMFMFFCSGANYFYNDYPVVSSPALNAAFLGAGTIYDGGNGFNQEPLQWIDAEYSWNVQSTGFYRDPKSYETAMTIRLDLQHNRVWPEEIFGQGGLLERACIRLYGEKAAPSMVRFNTLFEEASADETPPRMWPRLYPLTAMWRNLAVDRRTWGRQIEHVRLVQFMKEHQLSVDDLHSRLVSRWRKWERVTRQGGRLLEQALRVTGPYEESRADLEHLLSTVQLGVRFADLISNLHSYFIMTPGMAKEVQRELIRVQSERLEVFVRNQFGTETLHPSGGEVGSSLAALKRIQKVISSGN